MSIEVSLYFVLVGLVYIGYGVACLVTELRHANRLADNALNQ